MLFEIPNLSDDLKAQEDCPRMMAASNRALSRWVDDFKNQWHQCWDRSLTQSEMQARLDWLAQQPAIDLGQSTNALAKYFAVAARFMAYALNENPDAFAGALKDATGQLTQFSSPGWTTTPDNTKPSGLAVGAPVEWIEPN